MQPNEAEERLLDKQLDEICDGLREAVDREVEALRREGLPIYVSDNCRVVDLQKQEPRQQSKPMRRRRSRIQRTRTIVSATEAAFS